MAKLTIVTTGANSGIGFQTALYFARSGARVVMACRSMDKARASQQLIQQQAPNAETLILPLDVSELDSIREFVRLFADQVGELDILINNAGAVSLQLTRNSAGHELLFATNYLGAFALTATLMPYFKPGHSARIVNVGSIAHRFGRLNMDDLNWKSSQYNGWKAYANSKVALLSHTLELERRLRASARHIVALAAHPGVANTNFKQATEILKPPGRLRRWYAKHMTKIIPSAENAARPVIMAATSEHVAGGDYYGPGGLLELGGAPKKKARLNPVTRDPELSKRLWTLSEAMTDTQYSSLL